MMRSGSIRALTPAERSLAADIFGPALDLEPVRIFACPPVWRRAFVAGRWFGRDWMIYPVAEALDDFAGPQTPLRVRATLIHELTHVWQAQTGVNLLLAKLKAGDDAAAYAYHPGGVRPWAALNIEQQATLVEHLFLARRGGATPWPEATLREICPFEARI
jgi:hypothetical protein